MTSRLTERGCNVRDTMRGPLSVEEQSGRQFPMCLVASRRERGESSPS